MTNKVLGPQGREIEILLVEDNPGDARLAKEGLKEAKIINSSFAPLNRRKARYNIS